MTLDSRWIGIMLLTVGACGLLAADVGAGSITATAAADTSVIAAA